MPRIPQGVGKIGAAGATGDSAAGSTEVLAVEGLEEDVQLMLAVREGDSAAFDALFRRWVGPILRYLERMLRDPAVAEELAQEVFLRVHRARERYSPDAKFSTWLYTIATNLARNEIRRPRHRAVHHSTDPETEGASLELRGDTPQADDVVHARLVGQTLESELAALPERQRTALWLAAVEGLSYSDVAQALDTTEKSVKALVHRARTRLAERMGEHV